MSPSIKRVLWGTFGGLALLTAAGVVFTIVVLRMQQRQDEAVRRSRPVIDSVTSMDESLNTMVSAARGYILTKNDAFEQQYRDAVREFDKAKVQAMEQATDRDKETITQFKVHYNEIKEMTDHQIEYRKNGNEFAAITSMGTTADKRRKAQDYAGLITDRIRSDQSEISDRLSSTRQWLMMAIVFFGIGIIAAGAMAMWRVENLLRESLARQGQRTETMIGGMSEGVMLVDGEGHTVFINPAGQRLLGKTAVGVPIFRQSEVYDLRDAHGRLLDPAELPAAQALSTGRPMKDVTVIVGTGDSQTAVSMSATPLHEEGRTTGVIVMFRDVTERRALEEQMALQAERAQILADAGAFFSANIDPNWVTQAIAERTAEVLGDWSAVILKSEDAKELRVAAIHHRDIASLGLAWSYIYRQPLVVGEGLIGQVVATNYPSLTTNVRPSYDASNPGSMYHIAAPMKLASLLILPLRTRREMIGALVIAANDPDRAMTDDKLPLAEVLGGRRDDPARDAVDRELQRRDRRAQLV